jgi:putative hemolysin
VEREPEPAVSEPAAKVSAVETPAVKTEVHTKKVSAAAVAVAELPEVTEDEQEEVAKLAYSYWEARGGQHGSSDDDWYRAVQEVRRRRSAR